jgi:hypothetical protein
MQMLSLGGQYDAAIVNNQARAAVEYNIIRQREEFEKDHALAMRMEEII